MSNIRYTQYYNRSAAVAIARQYAHNYNPAYPDYEDSNSDCMNFVSQCLHAGGMPMKTQGVLWYCINYKLTPSWTGVDSFLAFLRKTIGYPRLVYEVHDSPEHLLPGDLVFVVARGTVGDITRNPSHAMIVSGAYTFTDDGDPVLPYCGHTENRLDQNLNVPEEKYKYHTYIHIVGIEYDFDESEWADSMDKSTAEADFGEAVLKKGASNNATHVANLQRRLNYPGFDCGEADGVYGTKTVAAVAAAQEATRHNITVDGKAGPETKEALRYPKCWFA